MRFKKIIALSTAPILLGGFLAFAQPNVLFAADAPVTKAVQACQGAGLQLGKSLGGMIGSLARILGISEQEVRDQVQEGKTFADIAESKGVSKEELTDKIIEERRSLLKQKVQEGVITEEDAKFYEERMKERIGARLDGSFNCGNGQKCGQGRGFGGGKGMRWVQ